MLWISLSNITVGLKTLGVSPYVFVVWYIAGLSTQYELLDTCSALTLLVKQDRVNKIIINGNVRLIEFMYYNHLP